MGVEPSSNRIADHAFTDDGRAFWFSEISPLCSAA